MVWFQISDTVGGWSNGGREVLLIHGSTQCSSRVAAVFNVLCKCNRNIRSTFFLSLTLSQAFILHLKSVHHLYFPYKSSISCSTILFYSTLYLPFSLCQCFIYNPLQIFWYSLFDLSLPASCFLKSPFQSLCLSSKYYPLCFYLEWIEHSRAK